MILKQKEIFNKPIDEKRNEILELSEKIIYGELTYLILRIEIFLKIFFNDFDNAICLFKKIGGNNKNQS